MGTSFHNEIVNRCSSSLPCWVHIRQDYAFLVYWSDGRCQNFAGFRQMTENNQFVTAASGSSCKQEMYCLNDAGSADCAAIAVLGGGQISIRTDNSRTVTEFFDNDAGTQYTSSSCVESNLYSNCWFNYYTEDQATKLFEDIAGCD